MKPQNQLRQHPLRSLVLCSRPVYELTVSLWIKVAGGSYRSQCGGSQLSGITIVVWVGARDIVLGFAEVVGVGADAHICKLVFACAFSS